MATSKATLVVIFGLYITCEATSFTLTKKEKVTFPFLRKGKLTSETTYSHLVFSIPVTAVMNQLEAYERAVKNFNSSDATWKAQLSASATELCEEAEAAIKFLQQSATSRTTRDALALVAGFEGLLNIFQSRHLSNKVEAVQSVTRHLVHEVDIMREHVEANEENLSTLLNDAHDLHAEQLVEKAMMKLQQGWHLVEVVVRAMVHMVWMAPSQRLHPAITQIVDMEDIWQMFNDRHMGEDWQPVVEASQHLFQLPASFWFDGHSLHVAVHVPRQKTHQYLYQLYEYRNIPIQQGSKRWTVGTVLPWIATRPEAGWHQLWSTQELESCLRLAGVYYCDQAMVTHMGRASSCLVHLWEEDFEAVKTTCSLLESEAVSDAWPIGNDTFLISTVGKEEAQVSCNGDLNATVVLEANQILWMKQGCRLTSKLYQLTPSVHVKEEVVQVSDRNFRVTFENGENVHIKPTEFKHLDKMAAKKKELLEILDEANVTSPYTWAAIGTAVAALMLCVVFIAVLYYRVKWGKLPGENLG